jgi:hypothetical protein
VSEKRKKVWIDRFQTHLFLRIVLYFVLYQIAVWCLVGLEQRLHGLIGTLDGGPSAYGSLATRGALALLGVLFICDALRLSHRIVGPLRRFRTTIHAVTAGDEVALVHLRGGDFLGDMGDELNEMLKALEQRGAVVLKGAAVKQEVSQPVPV